MKKVGIKYEPEFIAWVKRHVQAGVLRYDVTNKKWVFPLEIEDERVEFLEIMTRKEMYEYWQYLKQHRCTEVNIKLFEKTETGLKLRG